ncbi:protein LYK2-like [Rutidosis leptorrhynchoides]|uniref:protein LYK2-like n=1 Tax=Rutidosis leptorrhynchoides TaxID=125765 RepID=UPI003A99CCD3
MKSSKEKMKEVRVYIALSVVAFAICIAIATLVVYFIICSKRKKRMNQHISSCNKNVDLEFQKLNLSVRTASEKKVSFESSSQMESLDDHLLPTTPRKLMVVESYLVEELSVATAEFSSTNLIEGSVYHGRLKGKNVAIKCTDHDTISKIKFELFNGPARFHPNIIRLLGFCRGLDSPDTMTPIRDEFLVFEYAKNGSLKDWIHGGLAMKSHFIASCSCFLTWNQRLKICLDVANALQYMHQIVNPSYIHRNIKSRNIFLDEEFHAKVGNFGMDECVSDENDPEEIPSSGYLYSCFPTTWDKGYMAPEYSNSGVSSPNIDIYAFGVVLLEILSGKPPIKWVKMDTIDDGSRLSEKIKAILDSGNPKDMREWMDPALGENYSLEKVTVFAKLARKCVDDNPLMRPSAGELVLKLSELMVEKDDQPIVRESSWRPLVTQPVDFKNVN